MTLKNGLAFIAMALLSFFAVTGCEDPDGEGANVVFEVTSTPIFNAGPDGIEISQGPESTLTLTDGYFSFTMQITNNSEAEKNSLVIQEILVETTDENRETNEFQFSPGTFDLATFYIAHLDPAAIDSDGNPIPEVLSQTIYIFGLQEDNQGNFSSSVKVTLKGFFTGGRVTDADDVRDANIFALQGRPFRKVTVFQTSSN